MFLYGDHYLIQNYSQSRFLNLNDIFRALLPTPQRLGVLSGSQKCPEGKTDTVQLHETNCLGLSYLEVELQSVAYIASHTGILTWTWGHNWEFAYQCVM